MSTYDREYFIQKFTAIPDSAFCVGSFHDGQGRSCALGHCDNDTQEYEGLHALLWKPSEQQSCSCINDGQDHRYQQPTPRQRILAALHDLPTVPDGKG